MQHTKKARVTFRNSEGKNLFIAKRHGYIYNGIYDGFLDGAIRFTLSDGETGIITFCHEQVRIQVVKGRPDLSPYYTRKLNELKSGFELKSFSETVLACGKHIGKRDKRIQVETLEVVVEAHFRDVTNKLKPDNQVKIIDEKIGNEVRLKRHKKPDFNSFDHLPNDIKLVIVDLLPEKEKEILGRSSPFNEILVQMTNLPGPCVGDNLVLFTKFLRWSNGLLIETLPYEHGMPTFRPF